MRNFRYIAIVIVNFVLDSHLEHIFCCCKFCTNIFFCMNDDGNFVCYFLTIQGP